MTRSELHDARAEAAHDGYLRDFNGAVARGPRGRLARPWQYPREQSVGAIVAELLRHDESHELLAQMVFALRDAGQGMPRSATLVLGRLGDRYAMACMDQHFEMGDHSDAPDDLRHDDERAELAAQDTGRDARKR